MVGLHLIHNLEGIDTSFDHSATLLLEEWHLKKEFYNDGLISVCLSSYNGYPVNSYQNEDVIVTYEGLIYNKSNDEVFEFCKSLADKINDELYIKNEIGNFVDSADGDFIILIYNLNTKQYIIFNDLIGRLPLYYYSDPKLFISGRSIPFLLHNIPQIELDTNALTEFLLIEFLIGKNTMFKNIKRLSPAEIIIVTKNNDQLQINTQFAMKEDFTSEHPYKDKKLALQDLYNAFIKSTEDRVYTLKALGFDIYNTLSGGFDSRAIFGAINNITPDFTNVTYEYIQDESKIAQKVLEETQSKSHFVKLSFENKVNYTDSSLIFRTGGSVNIYTSSTCYNDSLFMKNRLLKNTNAVFGGFGGEFIRHPYHALPLSPYTYLSYYCASIPVQKILPILNVKHRDFKKFIHSTLNQYNEKTQEDVYKHLYNEYYRNQVVCAGEDRNRMFAWTVHPMMSVPFLKIIRKRVPLKWGSFQFFTDFMSKIDARLLNVTIFGKNVNLKDQESIKHLTPTNQKVFKTVLIILFRKYVLCFIEWRKRDNSNSIEFEKIDFFYQKLDFYKPLFNYIYIKKEYTKWPVSLKRGVLSLVMYMYELEKIYRFKLVK